MEILVFYVNYVQKLKYDDIVSERGKTKWFENGNINNRFRTTKLKKCIINKLIRCLELAINVANHTKYSYSYSYIELSVSCGDYSQFSPEPSSESYARARVDG